jgi:AraC family transcriptional regulator, ethanolamine operon transcriptional activator
MSASSSSHQAFTRPLRRMTRARDADEHARNLSQWDQRYDQLSPGAFSGEVTELWLPNSQIFVERANQQLRQTCAAWSRSVWFGIPDMADGLMSMGGKQLSSRAVCIRDGGEEFDLLTAPDFDLFGVVVDRENFARHLNETRHLDLDRLLQQGDVRDLAPGRKEHLCRKLANILSDANSCASDEDSVLDLQGRIFEALAGVLTSQDIPTRRLSIARASTISWWWTSCANGFSAAPRRRRISPNCANSFTSAGAPCRTVSRM